MPPNAAASPPMTLFYRELIKLTEDLQALPPRENEPVDSVLFQLRGLLRAIDAQNRRDLVHRVSALKQFWLESIPWCSALSRQVERLLIMFDDEARGGGCARISDQYGE